MSRNPLIETSADLGAVVKQTRRAAGITQQSLAELVGSSRQWVIRLEQGHHRMAMGTVIEVLRVLGLELAAQTDHAT
ncbi:MAG: helix-turn-helix domain-containing protein [Acidimicrobiaceae bacterium]|nr:helix-turn-helix domain-containing protein [Acidimicrobiaceae bacterium]MDE0606380.1 helix-turn-helix domain-containing protein [Acidimicrobiaceae bacterium]